MTLYNTSIFNKLKNFLIMDNNLEKEFETQEVGTAGQIRDIVPIIDVNGDFKVVNGKDAIIAQVRNLLMTPLGSYPFDPEYGSLLYKQLFELMTPATEEQIYFEVSDRIEKYIDGVRVESVDIDWNTREKNCKVNVVLYILDDVNKTKLSLFMQNYGSTMYDSSDDPVYGDYTF